MQKPQIVKFVECLCGGGQTISTQVLSYICEILIWWRKDQNWWTKPSNSDTCNVWEWKKKNKGIKVMIFHECMRVDVCCRKRKEEEKNVFHIATSHTFSTS